MNNAPFRVVCIADNTKGKWCFQLLGREFTIDGPKKGDVCTVIDVRKASFGGMCYSLEEWPDDINGDGWQCAIFRPIDPYENISSEIAQWKIVEEREDVVTTKEKIQL